MSTEEWSLAAPADRPAGHRRGSGRAPGTFGELLQGALPPDDSHFLVTFPIQTWSTVTFLPTTRSAAITVLPRRKHKARRLAETIMRKYGLPGGGLLEIDSQLPEGKGYASSSADLVGTCRAVADAFGLSFDERAIEALIRGIEPSDGVMYDGIVAFYHRQVRLLERFGHLPALTVVAHDEGGTIDTVCFDRIRAAYSAREKAEYAGLLATLGEAICVHDLATVGRVSTRSAVMNSGQLPRRDLRQMLSICQDVGGLGLIVAHSGTTLGILVENDDEEGESKISAAAHECVRTWGTVSLHRSLSSGVGLRVPPQAGFSL